MKPPRIEEIQHRVHGSHRAGRWNAKVATKVTSMVGTMWAAYLFLLLALISFPAAIMSHDPIIIVAWIAQTFLQLVLLPIIIVGQNIQAQFADHRSEIDHEVLADLRRIAVSQLTILEELRHAGENA